MTFEYSVSFSKDSTPKEPKVVDDAEKAIPKTDKTRQVPPSNPEKILAARCPAKGANRTVHIANVPAIPNTICIEAKDGIRANPPMKVPAIPPIVDIAYILPVERPTSFMSDTVDEISMGTRKPIIHDGAKKRAKVASDAVILESAGIDERNGSTESFT